MGGVIVAAIIVLFLQLIPQYQSIQELQVEIDTTKESRAERQAFLSTIDRKTNQLRAQAEHERELGLVMPASDSLDDVLRIIDRRANEAGVVIARISDTSGSVQSSVRASQVRGEETGLPSGIVPLGIRLSATGSYQQIRQLVDSLTASVRLIDVTNIQLSAGSQDQGEILGAEIELQFYSYEARQEVK